jgi:hypothetical protein
MQVLCWLQLLMKVVYPPTEHCVVVHVIAYARFIKHDMLNITRVSRLRTHTCARY